jgi:hypothetical protein
MIVGNYLRSFAGMLALLLKVLGFLGLGFAGFNAYLKIFANDEQLIAYAGSTRSLDMNFTVLAISLIFVALGKIIDNTNPPETD